MDENPKSENKIIMDIAEIDNLQICPGPLCEPSFCDLMPQKTFNLLDIFIHHDCAIQWKYVLTSFCYQLIIVIFLLVSWDILKSHLASK